jgi:hypothetical protein
MLSKNDLIELRDVRAADKNFIYATWLRGLYHGDTWFGEIPKDIFMKNYHKVLEQLLDPNREGISIRVACLKDEPDVILGYAVVKKAEEKFYLHWVHVKAEWRSIGICKMLIPETLTAVTHLTKVGRAILNKQKNRPVFNPFAL